LGYIQFTTSVPEHSAPIIYSSNFVINALEHVLTEEKQTQNIK
jgi:hypothetical protein